MRFDALVFGPGLPTAGRPGTVEIVDTTVHVRIDGAAHDALVSVSQLELREVGFGTPGIELAWSVGDDRWAAHVLDRAAAARLLALPAIASSPQAARLASSRRTRTVGRGLGWATIALIVAFPVLVLVGFLMQADRIAEWAVGRVSIETEARLGRAAFDDMRLTLQLQDSGPAYDAVRSIGTRLTSSSTYRYAFHVARDEAVNAFALPGGIVVVNTGLIAATKRPEELAGVLAHEVQHVEHRHSLAGMAKNLGIRAVWALVTGDVGGTLAGEAALQMATLRFSRAAEEQADADGFALLVDRGIDPSGMSAFFATLEAKGGAEPPALLSTHPASDGRARALAEEAKALRGRAFEPLSYGRWPPD
jgi:Zn-dependent protease with chaperone function